MYQKTLHAINKAFDDLGYKALTVSAFTDYERVGIAYAFYNLMLNPKMIMGCLKVEPDKKAHVCFYNSDMLLDTLRGHKNKELILINSIYIDNASTLEQSIYEYVKSVYAVQDRYDDSQEKPENENLTLDEFLDEFTDDDAYHDFFNLRFRPLPVLLDKQRNCKGVVVSDNQLVLCIKETLDCSLQFEILDAGYFATCNSSEAVCYPRQIQRSDYQSILDEIMRYIYDVKQLVKNYCEAEGLFYYDEYGESETGKDWNKLTNAELVESYTRGLVELSEKHASEAEVLLLNNAIKNLKAYIALQ